jgi:hypothetical protein
MGGDRQLTTAGPGGIGGERAVGGEGSVHTAGGSSGMIMSMRGGAKRVNGSVNVGGEGTGEIEAKGLSGPVAREMGVVGEPIFPEGEKVFPCSVGSREKTLDSGWAGCPSVGRIGSGVEVVGAPIRGGRTGFWA